MPRIRTVKPGYPKHRKVRKVCRDARLLNIHLWNLADDEGRLQELPQWIIGEVFPTDEDVTPVLLREWLGSLHDAGLIVRYEVDGEPYIQCHDFTSHQVINKPKPSEIPAPQAGSERSGSTPVVVPEESRPEKEEEREGEEEQGRGKGREAAPPDFFPDWLDHYRTTTGRQVRGSKPAKDAFRARVKDGYSLDELKLATVGCHGDKWCREHGHDVPETILRASKINRYIELAKQGPADEHPADKRIREMQQIAGAA